MDNEKKYIVLDYLYNLNLEKVKQYSESIYNSLNIGWQNYISIKDNNKNGKYKEKIEKNLEKLARKEEKNISFNESIKKCLEELQQYGLLNYKFKTSLLQNMKDINCLSEYFSFIVNKYEEIIASEEKKEKYNKEKIDMPYKVNTTEYYVIDKDGYYYYHVKLVKGSMCVVNSSLKAEKVLYKNALKDNKEIFKPLNKDIKIAPFERKRRIYIENIFNLDKLLLQLYDKNIDITYPLEKFYTYSNSIVDGLFHELNRSVDKKDIFDYIMNATIDNFNYEELANNYAKCVKKLNHEIKKIDPIIRKELILEGEKLKNRASYSDYKDIEGIVPSVGDIYRAVNKLVIYGLKHNYQENHLKMDEYIKNCTKYMNEYDIKDYYMEYKNILIAKVSYTECFINLQKSIVDILINKCHIDEKVIFNELLKEEKIY